MAKTTPSARSSKQEILDAYQALTKELEERDALSSTSSSATKLNTSATHTIDKPKDVIARLGDVRVQINSNLGEIVDQLVAESENLARMSEQAQALQQEIEQLHQIKAHASTLQNLITLNTEEQEKLDKKIQTQRLQWEQEQQLHDQSQKEAATEVAKQRSRAEEEYQYALNVDRKKEADAYDASRRQSEAALKLREEKISAEETTRQDLQKQVVELEKQLLLEVAKARRETEERVTKDLKTGFTLEMKGIEGERSISKLTIANLEKVITAQDAEMKDLKTQLTHATQQIKDIAVSVIETQKPSAPPITTPSKGEMGER